MDRLRLRQLVMEFATLAIDNIPVEEYEDAEEDALTIPEMLRLWGAEPECMLSSMFLGYVIGEGECINDFSPEALHLAVEAASLDESSNVDFDWIGDCDVTSKPN